MERDVEALLSGKPLPEESDAFLTAWKDAEREAIKSEYSFRSGYNVYKQVRAMWKIRCVYSNAGSKL